MEIKTFAFELARLAGLLNQLSLASVCHSPVNTLVISQDIDSIVGQLSRLKEQLNTSPPSGDNTPPVTG